MKRNFSAGKEGRKEAERKKEGRRPPVPEGLSLKGREGKHAEEEGEKKRRNILHRKGKETWRRQDCWACLLHLKMKTDILHL